MSTNHTLKGQSSSSYGVITIQRTPDYVQCPNPVTSLYVLTFVANVTLTKVRVKGEGPLGFIARALGIARLTVTMETRVDQHKDVQGQLHAEGSGSVLDPGVIGRVTRITLRKIERDLLAADSRRAGQVDVRETSVVGADVTLCKVHA